MDFTGSNPAPSPQHQAVSSVPTPALLSNIPSPTEAPQPMFTIRMLQQPEATRACGFVQRGRLMIDPPPILQMDVDPPTTTPEELKALIQKIDAVVHCTLWDPVNNRHVPTIPNPPSRSQQGPLVGKLVGSPFIGNDENDIVGCFFRFPDLSVRMPGNYSLKFRLFIIDHSLLGPGYRASARSAITSSPFEVYNAEDFNGMKASTELTKRLIPVKKWNAEINGKHNHDDDDDDDDLKEGSKGGEPATTPNL